ncbi:cupin domain-containing protein [Bradyrhizobium sp. CNPSo 4019]|uniref:Cupin domain-containing protein n=1 Tax=Bradyrhizobium diversitatis TaxID=2755406 RepID=A0ABS0PC12_9BRAD|nr:cupin domain-containing protein [Bradyrhizobium diversitatis]
MRSLEVTVGDERRVLGAGDAYYVSSRRPRRFRFIEQETCELVSACVPPSLYSWRKPT